VAPVDAEVLEVGRDDQRRRRPWLPAVLVFLCIVVAAGALVVQLRPWAQSQTDTHVKLLVSGPAGVEWIDVDSGRRTPAAPGVSGEDSSDAVVVGEGVVAREPTKDPDVADPVIGYSVSPDGQNQQPNDIGEADQIFPSGTAGVWLVVDPDGRTAGGAALASAYGDWRSRVFTVPPSLQVRGAFGDELVAVRGELRSRQLLTWDPQLQQDIRRLGFVIAVREVAGGYALVTTGCLSSGCTTALVNLTTGRRTDVRLPIGWSEVGEPRLDIATGGVTVVVRNTEGSTALAIGQPDDLQIVRDVTPAAGSQVVPAADGWYAVPESNGEVQMWRAGMSASELPTAQLSSGERLLGVAGAS
jgi:hypothetical protein